MGIDAQHPYGKSWQIIGGKLKMMALGKNLAVGVNRNNDIYFRTLSTQRPLGAKWVQISGKLSSIYFENGVIFGVNPQGELLHREGVSDLKPFGLKWTKDVSQTFDYEPVEKVVLTIANKKDEIFFQPTVENTFGTTWNKISGSLTQVNAERIIGRWSK